MELNKIINKLKGNNYENMKITDNKTLLICNVIHIAPEAWLHYIYIGLSDIEVLDIENKLGKSLPKLLKEFLKISNGINIFSDSISIWGRRTSYDRVGEEIYQPYDIVALNEELEDEISSKWLAFGSYSWDGSIMYYDVTKGDEKVFICERDSTKKIKEWDNIAVWFNEEINRLSKMYDEDGIEKDEDLPTIPF